MNIDIILESFPDIVETTKMLLEHETTEDVILWGVKYWSHQYHTKLDDIVIAIVNHLAENRTK